MHMSKLQEVEGWRFGGHTVQISACCDLLCS